MPKSSILRASLSREIKRLRSERGLSQTALAALSGIRAATVSDIEREVDNVTVDTIELLSDALGASPELVLVGRKHKK